MGFGDFGCLISFFFFSFVFFFPFFGSPRPYNPFLFALLGLFWVLGLGIGILCGILFGYG